MKVFNPPSGVAKFNVDTTVLVQEYLIPMVVGMFLIASHLDEQIHQSLAPTALCLGVGGGVLLNFLDTEMVFVVTGVEADEMVLESLIIEFSFHLHLSSLSPIHIISGLMEVSTIQASIVLTHKQLTWAIIIEIKSNAKKGWSKLRYI